MNENLTVKAHIQVMELTKAGSAIEFEVFDKGNKLGTVIIGRGSLTWRNSKKHYGKRFHWRKFAKMMDEM